MENGNKGIIIGVFALVIAFLSLGYSFYALNQPDNFDLSDLIENIDNIKKDNLATNRNIVSIESSNVNMNNALTNLITKGATDYQTLNQKILSLPTIANLRNIEQDVENLQDAFNDCLLDSLTYGSINYINHEGNNQTMSFYRIDESDLEDCLDNTI